MFCDLLLCTDNKLSKNEEKFRITVNLAEKHSELLKITNIDAVKNIRNVDIELMHRKTNNPEFARSQVHSPGNVRSYESKLGHY